MKYLVGDRSKFLRRVSEAQYRNNLKLEKTISLSFILDANSELKLNRYYKFEIMQKWHIF